MHRTVCFVATMGFGVLMPGSLALAAETEAASPMTGTFWQSLAAIVAFLILLAVLYKYAWGPILSGLQAREEKIRNDLSEAERANAEAKQNLEQYKQQLAEALAEARKVLEKAREDGEQLRQRLRSETEDVLAQQRQRASDEIRLAKQEAVEELYAKAANLATAVAGKILQREIGDQDTQRLVDESLNELEQGRLN